MLNSREIQVINTIVSIFLNTGQPVGSRTVAKKSELGLSAASIRNVMADLTEKGFLHQPHTSAGRIPTSEAIRFYLQNLFTPSPLSQEEKEKIFFTLKQNMPDMEQTLKSASKLLSLLSEQVSLVVSPQKKLSHWKQIEFVLIKPGIVLTVLVLEEGLTQHKVIKVNPQFTQDDLFKFSNILNEKFKGQPLFKIKLKILEQIRQTHLELESLYQKAISVVQKTFEGSSRKIFIEGTSKIIDQEQIKDFKAIKKLFALLEEQSSLLELLEKTIEAKGLNIIVGPENIDQNYSLISSTYLLNEDTWGVVSIIGPMSMNYAQIIPRVDLISKVLTQIFQEFY